MSGKVELDGEMEEAATKPRRDTAKHKELAILATVDVAILGMKGRK